MDEQIALRLQRQAKLHSAAIDSLVGEFEGELQKIVNVAQARTLAELQQRLAIADGEVLQTAANARVLRDFTAIWKRELNDAGFQQLVNSYADSFSGQLPYFEEVVKILGDASGQQLKLNFSPESRSILESQQLGSADSLADVVARVGNVAKQKALFSFGGLRMKDLAETLAEQLGKTVPEAARLADTAISVYYRTIADRGFQEIEKDLPADFYEYAYYGPDDLITRPFCRRLVESDQTYTRTEIEAMDNGQLPNPFLTAGGYRCRHQWVLAARTPQRSGSAAA